MPHEDLPNTIVRLKKSKASGLARSYIQRLLDILHGQANTPSLRQKNAAE